LRSCRLASAIEFLRSVIADLRADRDHWRDQAQRLALAAPMPAEPSQTS
jgi:hypothetical protein